MVLNDLQDSDPANAIQVDPPVRVTRQLAVGALKDEAMRASQRQRELAGAICGQGVEPTWCLNEISKALCRSEQSKAREQRARVRSVSARCLPLIAAAALHFLVAKRNVDGLLPDRSPAACAAELL